MKAVFFSTHITMTITIINDCRDANAAGRQVTRAISLLGGQATFIGVSNDLEASGNLVDAIDAIEDQEGVILVNVAPRNGQAKKWGNGTPFGYFWYKKILIIASIDGLTLSLAKKLNLVSSINVLDIPIALDVLVKNAGISIKSQKYITNSQFRSYDFLSRIAAYLLRQKNIQSTQLNFSEVLDAPPAIWWIDNFGNCKTTVLLKDITRKTNNRIITKVGELPYFPQLKDIPDKCKALTTGSSGIGDKHFLEIVIQGGSAAKYFNLSSGDLVF